MYKIGSQKSSHIFFCNDVLEMTQNRPQPEVGPELLFSVLTNTTITSKIPTPSKSATSYTTLSKCIKQQSIYFKEQP